jgi:tRNA threonylcarbamoyladenosine biosynthesis protein TsaB
VRILGIDTATWKASVGLRIDDTVVCERSQLADGSHAVSLLRLIDDVLHAGGCAVADLDAIAVSGGPGSFTGLRISLSVAKGLAFASGARLIAVPTLEALARTVADHGSAICALLDARKREVYAACFNPTQAGLQRLTADLLLTPEALADRLPVPCVILGDGVTAYGAFLQSRLLDQVTLLPADTYGPRGGTVATMGAERLRAGHIEAFASLEPTYIRPSEAELKAL